MPHPKGGYRDADGKRIPGVTTVIGRFKESGGLIRWAYNRGRDGEELYESRDKAAEAGTAAHEMCERHIKGGILIEGGQPTAKAHEVANVPDEMFPLVWSSFQAYLAWERQTQLKIVETEQSYISAKGYGGTYDAIGEIDGKLCLLDWKTSNAVYGDHIYQLGAYKALWEENNPEKKLDGCQWRSKKGPPRRCKKGPLGGCGLVPVVHGRAPRATRRALNRLTRRRAREGPVGPRGQAWAGWSVQFAVGV